MHSNDAENKIDLLIVSGTGEKYFLSSIIRLGRYDLSIAVLYACLFPALVVALLSNSRSLQFSVMVFRRRARS